jgi:hypothetical protein
LLWPVRISVLRVPGRRRRWSGGTISAKVQKDERTFAQNLLHVAAVDYDLISKVSGSNFGPDFGKDAHNPSRDVYKTKADVVKLHLHAEIGLLARSTTAASHTVRN